MALLIAPDLDTARWFIEQHGAPTPLSVAVAGAHAWGFASADSDLDLKGIHVAPTAAVLALQPPGESIDVITEFDGTEIDYTSHEIGFALRLLVKGNGNMLERILSPFQVLRSDRREVLQGLTRASLSRRFYSYYRDVFGSIQDECREAPTKTARSYLYAYRTALTGIHLLRTGECVMDVEVLTRDYGFTDHLPELLERKRAGTEQETASDVTRYEEDWVRLEVLLDAARRESPLPEHPPNVEPLSEFLIEERRRHF
jgi:predicted nucleotidyltransferase